MGMTSLDGTNWSGNGKMFHVEIAVWQRRKLRDHFYFSRVVSRMRYVLWCAHHYGYQIRQRVISISVGDRVRRQRRKEGRRRIFKRWASSLYDYQNFSRMDLSVTEALINWSFGFRCVTVSYCTNSICRHWLPLLHPNMSLFSTELWAEGYKTNLELTSCLVGEVSEQLRYDTRGSWKCWVWFQWRWLLWRRPLILLICIVLAPRQTMLLPESCCMIVPCVGIIICWLIAVGLEISGECGLERWSVGQSALRRDEFQSSCQSATSNAVQSTSLCWHQHLAAQRILGLWSTYYTMGVRLLFSSVLCNRPDCDVECDCDCFKEIRTISSWCVNWAEANTAKSSKLSTLPTTRSVSLKFSNPSRRRRSSEKLKFWRIYAEEQMLLIY